LVELWLDRKPPAASTTAPHVYRLRWPEFLGVWKRVGSTLKTDPPNPRKYTQREVLDLVANNEIVVVHFDAEWNGQRHTVARKIYAILNQSTDVAFAYVEVDEEIELASSMRVISIPMLAYFRNGKLVGAVSGNRQNIFATLEKVRSGQSLDTSNSVTGQ
jgi:thioredoxin 1